MKIRGGKVFGTDHRMHDYDLYLEDGVIKEIREQMQKEEVSEEGQVFDATGCYVLPGLIDTHLHGAAGIEFYLSEGEITPALDWLACHGVTGVLPATCCETPQELEADILRLTRTGDPRVLGVHAEGPFINPVRKGGMFEHRIQKPDVALVKQMYEVSGGQLKIMTMAPELEGIEAVIDCCKELGIRVSMGHSDGTYAEASRAVDRGASRLTHTFNAMRGYNHREPGVLGCALDDERVECELICDLYHVSAPAIRLVLRSKGVDKVTMISDCSKFCGVGDGEYDIAGRTIYVRDGLCQLADGTICGSSRCLSDGARNMFHLGFAPEEIAVMACVNPARACGCSDRGELGIGYRADVVVFDQDFQVKAVFLAGERIV